METKEIIDIIVGILAGAGLAACFVAASYCTYSMVVIDRQIKRELKRMNDEPAKLEKEE
jgi:pheromone shutdown protein TraB